MTDESEEEASLTTLAEAFLVFFETFLATASEDPAEESMDDALGESKGMTTFFTPADDPFATEVRGTSISDATKRKRVVRRSR